MYSKDNQPTANCANLKAMFCKKGVMAYRGLNAPELGVAMCIRLRNAEQNGKGIKADHWCRGSPPPSISLTRLSGRVRSSDLNSKFERPYCLFSLSPLRKP